ncbi:MAG: DNA translocase FtsK [Deltaproteobacteria bacterium]|nr:MAG: DNA translocase FtsK [Deltaproteobacteria bacterium]
MKGEGLIKDVKKDVLGLSTLALGIILFLSLVSYNPFDPSFSTYSTELLKVKNWCGRFGAYSSDLLIQWFGIGSLVIPVVFIFQAFLFFQGHTLARIGLRSISIFFSLITAVSLLSIYGDYATFFGVKFHLGGIVGYAVGRGMVVTILGKVGGTVFLLTLFSVFLIISTGVTVADLRSLLGRKKERKERVRKKIKEDLSRPEEDLAGILEPPLEEPLAEDIEIYRAGEKARARRVRARKAVGKFHLPPVSLLEEPPYERDLPDEATLLENARLLLSELRQFGVDGEVTSVKAGPMVTLYEFKPAPGKKLSSIVKLSEDLALALKAESLRIIKNIPGRGVMGIEVPNRRRERVYLREIIESREFQEASHPLTIAVGLDILGNPVVADLSRMPHLLIAGTTGSGKSVALNSMILSLLYRTTPEELRLILVDPKMLEFNPYDGIPNLLHPVVTQPRDAAKVLKWAVMEMESRYRLMMENGVRNIDSYNALVRKRKKSAPDDDALSPMPFIVIVIDELSDLMISSAREVEESITRLSQMARASGIHLIVATQRPSVDVITGVIKANFPCRISFKVSSRYDSHTILGEYGAELLLGQGDMLFLRPGPERIIRVHAPYVSEEEVRKVVSYLKEQGEATYEESLLDVEGNALPDSEGDDDEKYEEAVRLVTETGRASISYIQRKLGIGFNRAARIMERMEEEGIVTPPGPGGKGRQVRRRPPVDD